MEELVHWTNQTLDERVMHPLLAVAAFVVRFLAVPFRTGTDGSRVP
jgi:hypothetical protein